MNVFNNFGNRINEQKTWNRTWTENMLSFYTYAALTFGTEVKKPSQKDNYFL